MKITRIEHIGMAVKDIDKVLPLYRDFFHLPVTAVNSMKGQGAKNAFVTIGESSFELLSPEGEPPAGSTGDVINKFINNRGEGIQHVALAVDNIEAALEELAQKGLPLIDKKPRPGAHGKIAFIHPKSTYGVLVELCQPEH